MVSLDAGRGIAGDAVPLPPERPATLNERFIGGVALPPATSQALPLAPAPELHDGVFPPAGPEASACDLRLGDVAAFTPLPALIGPGACGGRDIVRLSAVLMPDGSRVGIEPPATLRCGMAEAVALWVRADMPAATARLGASVASLTNYDSFDCRGRNRIVGAKLSEHGKANAMDVRAFKLTNGKTVFPTDPLVTKDFRDAMRASVCARFKTVLGPGSDGYHEDHIHLDLAERSRGYAICHWDVRSSSVAVSVPLPAPRPTALIEAETP